MGDRSVPTAIESLGYRLLPQTHRGSPGGCGLVVAIRSEPSRRRFDPTAMRLRLRDLRGMATWRSLSPRSPQPGSDHVCPGRLILSDRSDRRVEFFTFGGSLEIIPAQEAYMYGLHSPAPVLELVSGEETVACQLAAETESLLGQLGVQWGHDEQGFSRRLAEIEPLQFYMGTLCYLLEQYRRCHALEEIYQELCDVLRREKRWLVSQALWPRRPRLLPDMLAPV